MTLKGEARTNYMRAYMRKRRGVERAAKAAGASSPKHAQAHPEAGPRPDHAALAQAQARIAELEARVRELEAKPAAAPLKSASSAKQQQDSREHIRDPREQLHIRRLQAELGRTRELLAKAEDKVATVPPAERDRVIERLKTENRNLKAEIRHTVKWTDDKVARAKKLFDMPRELTNALHKNLHPDFAAQSTVKTRADAFVKFTEWRDKGKARR
jgi:hypothetical protein